MPTTKTNTLKFAWFVLSVILGLGLGLVILLDAISVSKQMTWFHYLVSIALFLGSIRNYRKA